MESVKSNAWWVSKFGTLGSLLIFLSLYFYSSNLYSQNNTGEKTSDYTIPKLLENQVINQNEKSQGTNIRTSSIAFSNNVTYNYTGAQQSFVVPCGVTQIYVTIAGAEGGTGAIGGNASSGGVGGKGSVIKGFLNVTPGQTLNIFVGGAGSAGTGGYNGGGSGGNQNGGGGGGASDIRFPGITTANRILVAGGGGGGGRAGCESTVVNGGAGGNGDGNGANGNNAPTSGGQAGGGGGAIGQNFGVKGIGCGGFLGQDGTSGNAFGQGGNGGNGQSCCCFTFASIPGGGGGGGGYLGGGGGGGGSAGTTGCSGNDKGAGGGGAGGTSYLGGLILSQLLTGVNSGNGQVIISYDPNSTLEIDSLDITQPTCSIASAININASLVIAGNLDASDSVQVGRLNRFAVVSTCANPKSVPTLYSASGNRKFDLYSFPNNTGGTQCYEIRITDPGITKFMVAYLNKFDPTLVNNNYLGDPGSSGNIFMSVNVPNGDTLVLIVHEVNSGGGIGAYTLRIRNQSLFNFSANNGSTYSASSLISAVPGGNNNCRVKLVGTTCVSSPFVGKVRVVETSAVNQNLVTNYPNNLLLKHTTQSFFATNKIFSPSIVTYKAEKAINLNPGFEAGTGAVFKAAIGGCTD